MKKETRYIADIIISLSLFLAGMILGTGSIIVGQLETNSTLHLFMFLGALFFFCLAIKNNRDMKELK